MKYNGKRGLWWFLVVLFYNLTIVWCIIKRETYQGFWVCLVLLLLGDIFLLAFTIRTYVLLEKGLMTVVLGFFRVTIDCQKISSIEKSKNPIASMALSFDRLKILYGNDCIFISVKNKNELIKDLLKINPNIRV